MVVQHNLTAMNSNRMFNVTSKTLSKSSEKLSSGFRINRAADDAAGLSISEKMRKQIRGLTQASANAQDGISMVQVADGAMAEVSDMLQRMNELAVKSANGTLSQDDRNYIQNEIDQLMTEIDRIGETTKFNELYVLKGNVVETEGPGFIGLLPPNVSSPELETQIMKLYSDLPTELHNYFDTYLYNHRVGGDYCKAGGAEGGYTNQIYVVNYAEIDFSQVKSKADVEKLYDTGFSANCSACPNFYAIQFTSEGGGELISEGSNQTLTVNISECNNGTEIVKQILDTAAAYWANDGSPRGYTGGATPADPSEYTNADGSGKYDFAYGIGNHIQYVATRESEKDKLMFFTIYKPVGRSDAAAQYADNLAAAKEASQAFFDDPINNPGYQGKMAFRTGIYRSSVKDIKATHQKVSLQVGADATSANQIDVELSYISSFALGLKSYNAIREEWNEPLSVKTQSESLSAISIIDDAIKYVASERSRMGAYQNRLEHTINNLDNVVENTTASESAIRDTDMSKEMVAYSNNNILAIAGQAILAQANQSNQGVLYLLQ